MSIESGREFLHYRVVGKLGEGGMGVVWRALDTKLDREVALKALPPQFAEDPDRMARFEREAKVLASLTLPNVAAVFGKELVDGEHLLVMELVEGEDLAARLARGPLDLDEVLEMGRQLATGLEEAHDQGIVHRDLKPANLKWSPDGRLKILDFGLAKALDSAPSGSSPLQSPSLSPTLATLGTADGVILGTAAYMSPEQAKGRSVDRRADIWALGVVLFESLTGRRLFEGESVSETLAAVLMSPIEWDRLPATTPPALRRLLERCLERDPKKRLRDAGEARLVLERLLAGETEPEAAVAAGGRGRSWAWCLGGLLAGALALAPFVGGGGEPVAPVTPMRVAIPLVPSYGLVISTSRTCDLALSEDGRSLAFVGRAEDEELGLRQLLVRHLDRPSALPLEATGSLYWPFFSPDGEWIAYFHGGALRRVTARGGPPDTLHDFASGGFLTGGTWSEELGVVFTRVSFAGEQLVRGLYRLDPEAGGLSTLHEETVPRAQWRRGFLGFPEVLPGGRHVVWTRAEDGEGGDERWLEVFRVADGELRRLRPGGQARYLGSGYLAFANEERLFAAPFDAEAAEFLAEPQVVMEGLLASDPASGGRVAFTASRTGSLAWVPATASVSDEDNLLWFSAEGESRPAGGSPRYHADLRISPDGSRVAFAAPDGEVDVWVHDLERGTESRLTFDAGEDETPIWLPDGEWIAFSSSREDEDRTIRRARADGSGDEVLLWEGEAHTHPSSVTPDGRTLIVDARSRGGYQIWALDAVEGGEPRVLLEPPYMVCHARLSPDGRWLAYTSDETGRREVHALRWPDLDAKFQVSNDGGSEPIWSDEGRRLTYLHGNTVMEVAVAAEDARPFGKPDFLFQGGFGSPRGANHFRYDVAPDGRFLMTRPEATAFPKHLPFALAWDRELADRFGR